MKLPSTTDTIVAPCTPPGHGGVGIVRVSGPLAKMLAEKMVGFSPRPRYAHYTDFLSDKADDGAVIDQGLVLYFPAPHSFTGEEVVEFQGHGGPVVLDEIISTLIRSGARLAEPGEFSLRAYLNGKIDLLQAEAVADLIGASTQAAKKGALQSLQGVFSDRVKDLNKQVIRLRVFVEAAMDFPEEEIDFLKDAQIDVQLMHLESTLETIFESAKQGSLLQEGKTIVILGAPNVGKSSLLNKLAGKDLAIVTSVPGTTRDLIKAPLNIDGYPLFVIDTAGIRDTQDEVEIQGISRAEKSLVEADLILYMRSQTEVVSSGDAIHALLAPYQEKTIQVVNKIDLIQQGPALIEDVLYISVKEDQGLDLLKNYLKKKMGVQGVSGVFSARRRHVAALEKAATHLAAGKEQLVVYRAAELLAQELKYVSQALSELTGEFSTEDLLGEIFSSFCIGK